VERQAGVEAQPEIVASRVLWALGYHQPPTYLLRNWELTGTGGGPQTIARFRRESAGQKVVSDWSWYENPFAATRPFKGLVVANLLLTGHRFGNAAGIAQRRRRFRGAGIHSRRRGGTCQVFEYNGANARLVNALTVDDVVWTCRLLARISDDQWNDAFRAAAYPEAELGRFIRKVKAKITEGLGLSRS
jgi:hypothetical protein